MIDLRKEGCKRLSGLRGLKLRPLKRDGVMDIDRDPHRLAVAERVNDAVVELALPDIEI